MGPQQISMLRFLGFARVLSSESRAPITTHAAAAALLLVATLRRATRVLLGGHCLLVLENLEGQLLGGDLDHHDLAGLAVGGANVVEGPVDGVPQDRVVGHGRADAQ